MEAASPNLFQEMLVVWLLINQTKPDKIQFEGIPVATLPPDILYAEKLKEPGGKFQMNRSCIQLNAAIVWVS